MTEGLDKRQCSATTRKGAQCRGVALPDSDVCALHSPAAVEGRRQGGVASSHVQRGLKRLPPNLKGVMDLIATAVQEVYDGELKPAQLQAMAAGGRTLIELVEAAVLAPELEALRLQVAELLVQKQQEGGRYVEL